MYQYFHMLSDVLALFVAYVSVYVSPKSWSRNTYGFARAEVLGALTNSVFLMALCFSIFTDSTKRIAECAPSSSSRSSSNDSATVQTLHGAATSHRDCSNLTAGSAARHDCEQSRCALEKPELILIVGGVGLLINVVGLFMFHDHGHSHGGGGGTTTEEHHRHDNKVIHGDPETAVQAEGRDRKESMNTESELKRKDSLLGTEASVTSTVLATVPSGHLHSHAHTGHHKVQMNIRGVFLHVLADALGSVVVMVSASVYLLSEDFEYKDLIDPCLSIILVLLIVCATWPLFKDAAFILLQSMPNDMEATELKERLLRQVPEIEQIHEFHVWQLVATRVVASVHVKMGKHAPKDDHMKFAEKIKEVFHNEGIHATTVQLEYKNEEAQVVNKKGCCLPCPLGHSSTKCSEAPLPLPDTWAKRDEKVRKYLASSSSSRTAGEDTSDGTRRTGGDRSDTRARWDRFETLEKVRPKFLSIKTEYGSEPHKDKKMLAGEKHLSEEPELVLPPKKKSSSTK